MWKLITIILLLSSSLCGNADAAELLRIVRVDNGGNVQLYLNFDTLPRFSSLEGERRLDLLLTDTALSPELNLFAPDEHIVKILPRTEGNTLVLSFYFRYSPQKFRITPTEQNRLVVEILLGNQYSRDHQELADRLKGLSMIDRSAEDRANPTRLSPYARDWRLFFAGYESPLQINVPVRFTPVPFPLVRLLPPGEEANLSLFSPELLALAAAGEWRQVGQEILQTVNENTDITEKKLLALTFGEVLARQGALNEAEEQLRLLQDNYRGELLGSFATFLLLQLQAAHASPHLAGVEFAALEKAISASNPLAPYLLLARIETALPAGNLSLLNTLLQRDDIALPEDVAQAVQLHQANYWYALGQPVKAHAAYRLHADSAALAERPYSRNGQCDTLYFMKEFAQAEQCYQNLAPLIADKNSLGLVVYRQHLAALHHAPGSADIDTFTRLENAYAGTEAGLRAAMKRNDLEFLAQPDRPGRVLDSYQRIADQIEYRFLREEALFKKALIERHQENYAQAIELAGQILREFRSGPVRISAQALLIELLPDEIRRLVAQQEYLAALVLARQNRQLFESGWINADLLVEIAETYQKLGFYEEAQNLYLYVIEITSIDRRDQYFLPMIAAAYEQGSYSLVDDYAAQYAYNHPDGRDREQILHYRLRALKADGRVAEALALLPEPLPETEDFQKLAAGLFFHGERFQESRKILEEQQATTAGLNPLERFMLAESLFQSEDYPAAQSVFAGLTEEHPFYDQSLFRQAEIAKRQGNRKIALSLLQKIVETGKSPAWIRLAEQELRYAGLTEKL